MIAAPGGDTGRPARSHEQTWAWDRSDVAEGVQLVEVDFTEHPDGTTTVVMTNRGLVEEQARESHRVGWGVPSTTSPAWSPDEGWLARVAANNALRGEEP